MAAGLGGALALLFTAFKNQDEGTQKVYAGGAKPAPLPRENAVLVFGSTGKMGRLIVQQVFLTAPHHTPAFNLVLRSKTGTWRDDLFNIS